MRRLTGPTACVIAAMLAGSTAGRAQLASPPAPGGQSTSPGPLSPASPSPGAPASGQGLLAPAAPAVRGRYVDAVPSVIRDRLTGHVTLALDVTPKPGMRVYAPGNPGYTPVAVTLDGPAATRFAATAYPPAEAYLFVPLNERVKVYRSTFRLTRAETAEKKGGRRAAPAALVTGRLDYQACDDKVCYLPQTLPITWSLEK